MADSLSKLLELKQQLGFLEGGGQEEYATDKLNKTFGALRQTGLDINKIRNDASARAVEKKKLELLELENKRKGEEGARQADIYKQTYGRPDVKLPEGVEGPLEQEASPFEQKQEADLAYKRAQTEKESRVTPGKKGIHMVISKKTGKVLYEFPSSEGTGDTITTVGDDEGEKEDKVQSRKDEASRQAVNVIKNYYSSVRNIQGGTDVGAGQSLGVGIAGLTSRIPAIGRALQPETSQLTGFRTSQGARLAKSFGDSGNIALQEQKNALELLAPPGTRNLDVAEKQALTTALEGIKNRTPEEESLYQEVKKSFDLGAEPQGTGAVPRVGETFNGEKVIGVRKIK